MDNRPIGMFDSGVGGITVLKEFLKKCPREEIVYLGDTKRFPYGNKPKEDIIAFTKNGIDFLVGKGAKAVIIACGTATSQALEEVQGFYDIPVIGIIDETVNYVKEKGYKKIGVIATAGTIRSKGWRNRLYESIPDADISDLACPLLAPMAEEGRTDNKVVRQAIKAYLKDLKNVECLILGCTHYPLFTRLFEEELGEGTEVINTGTVLSEKTREMLVRNHTDHEPGPEGQYRIYLTARKDTFAKVAGQVLQDHRIAEKIQIVDL